jgi:hypothetical protein
MKSELDRVCGKVFVHQTIAEDDCGNFFAVLESGAIAFWDHETDALTPLAISLQQFMANCTDPASVKLKPGQVKSVWINPEFAKQLGIEVSADGKPKKQS